jgi:flagellar hook protein FlgE
MSMGSIATTGLIASQTQMEVISNNIANVNTVGFKRSAVDFANVYPNTLSNANSVGLGVQVSDIQQDFTVGAFVLTGNGLDLSISNNDAFLIQKNPSSGTTSYTRAGNLTLDSNGYLLTPNNDRLQGFPYDDVNKGFIDNGTRVDLQVPTTSLPASATTTVDLSFNLDASSVSPLAATSISAYLTTPFSPTNSDTYNYVTNSTVYDSLGGAHTLSNYYVHKQGASAGVASDSWYIYPYFDGVSMTTTNGGATQQYATVTFSNTGSLSTTAANFVDAVPTAGLITGFTAYPQSSTITNGANTNLPITMNFRDSTQYSAASQVYQQSQDGYTQGAPTGFAIDDSGVITSYYSNALTTTVGQIALAIFPSISGLGQTGYMSWNETSSSGAPKVTLANSENALNVGVLESSNVNLTTELVKLIDAQNGFQANAQVQQAYNKVMETIQRL